MLYLIVGVVSYLIGSLSFAYIVSRIMRLPNPRDYGSGNAGATNVLRTGNKKAAYLVLLGDLMKGVLVVLAAKEYSFYANDPNVLIGISAVFVFLGHLFPIFFNFKGGKGVATSAGILLAVEFNIGLLAITVWLLVAFLTRYSSLAALMAAFASFITTLVMAINLPIVFSIGSIFILILIRHKQNIKQLITGDESKISLSSSSSAK